jgi:putative oxidoreductase
MRCQNQQTTCNSQIFEEHHLAHHHLAAIAAIAVELLAPIAIIVGFKTRYAAAILALFTVAASFSFHKFWALPADQVMMSQMMFFKNLAIAGGLLILAAHSGLCAKKA